RNKRNPKHHVPVVSGQNTSGSERTSRHRSENDEVVKRLDGGLLFGPVTLQHQRRCPDEAEIPAHAEQDESKPEVRYVEPRQPHGRRYAGKQKASHNNAPGAEARNEAAGEKTWRIHGDDMPLKPKVGTFL